MDPSGTAMKYDRMVVGDKLEEIFVSCDDGVPKKSRQRAGSGTLGARKSIVENKEDSIPADVL
jgi:hypothetical protein